MRVRVRTLVWLLVIVLLIVGAVVALRFLAPEQYETGRAWLEGVWMSPRVQGYQWPALEDGACKIKYQEEIVQPEYAEAILTICSSSLEILQDVTSRSLPSSVQLYAWGGDSHYFWTDGSREIHVVFEGDTDLLPPGLGGNRNHVANLAHTMGLFVNCVDTGEGAFPANEVGTALANYLALSYVVPRLYDEKGEALWPVPYNYALEANPAVYLKYAPKGERTRAAERVWGPADVIWFTMDTRHGQEKVGEVLRKTCAGGRTATLDDLADTVIEVTGDKELARDIRRLGAPIASAAP
jgi:hypothetical protein